MAKLLSPFTDLRNSLMLIIAFATVPMLGFILFNFVEEQQLLRNQVLQDTQVLTQLLAKDQRELSEISRAILTTIAQLPPSHYQDLASCNRILATLHRQFPLYANLGLIEPDGQLYCSAVPFTGSISAGDRLQFRQALKNKQFTVGNYPQAGIPNAAALFYGYPLLNRTGETEFLLFAILDPNWINQAVTELPLSPGASFTVINRQGIVIARYPDPQKWVGQSIPQAALVDAAIHHDRQELVELVDLDGTRRLFAFNHLATGLTDNELIVSVGVPPEVAFAEPDRILRRNLGILGLVIMTGLVLAFFVSNRFVLFKIKRLLLTTERLTTGELSARTQLPYDEGEFGQLAYSFDRMAAMLEQRHLRLEQQTEILQTIFDYIPVIIVFFDKEGRIKMVNREWERVMGWSLAELQEIDIMAEVYPDPDDRREALAYMQAATPGWRDFKVRTKDGTVWDTAWANVRLSDGTSIGFGQDITERKRAEEALRQSEERYRMVSELTSDYAYVIRLEPDGYPVCEWMTEAFERVTGFSPDEVITGGHWSKFLHPDDQDVVMQRRIRLAARQPFVGEYRIIDKEGRIHWVRDHVRPIWDESQERLVGVYGAAQDITERRQAEEETLRRNRELTLLNRVIAASATSVNAEEVLDQICRDLALAFNVSQTVVVLLNKKKTEGTVVAEYRDTARYSVLERTVPVHNNRFYQYLLMYKAPLVIKDVRIEPDLPLLYEEMRQNGMVSLFLIPLIVEGQVIGNLGMNTLELRSFSSEEISLAWSVADQVAGVLARIHLAEERHQLEERYHQSQKMEMVGQLAAGIAHDFNNLLTAINGFAALLEDELSTGDPRQELASKILHSGQRAADLVRQLLAFSRKQIIRPQKLNLNTSVMTMKKILERTIGENIVQETRLWPELWPVEVDPSQVEQIIVNLAVNARDAMPLGGRLTLETQNVVLDEEFSATHPDVDPGEYIMLIISDTGVGMSETVRTHIFEPFFTTKEVGKGTGLGLATVFGIVKQNKGHIEVSSEPGKGATFKIYLPRVPEKLEPAPTLNDEEAVPLGNETILLVEDDVEVRRLAERVLQKQGYLLLEAANGHEALELAAHQTNPIHLLLTDVVMPGISGLSLAEQLRRRWPALKVLFISGYTDNTLSTYGVLESGVTLLSKPFTPSTLARQVRAILDEKGTTAL